MLRTIKLLFLVCFAFFSITNFMNSGLAQRQPSDAQLAAPKTWDDAMVKSSTLPLAQADASPVHISSDYYYSIPVRQLYKSYAIYAPGKEPPGYQDWLKQQEPEPLDFDPSKFKTEEDWIKAGETIFDTGIFFNTVIAPSDVTDPNWYEKSGVPLTKDGVMPFARYVIRKKGVIEVGNISCAQCHTRVLPDNTVVKGGQGNFPFGKANSMAIQRQYANAVKNSRGELYVERSRLFVRAMYATPWLHPDPNARVEELSLDELIEAHALVPAGTLARQSASLFSPVKVPSLIGIKDSRYLDITGLVRHRSIADLMRYAAFNQGADDVARYGDFMPYEVVGEKNPAPASQLRYTDEQLYALALYIYSLKPPPNPNKFDALAVRGKKVFDREGCGGCHTPPLYTNNRLTPAEGFKPPDSHLKKFDILPISVGTDPTLTLKTRRGTGYYKVPSLRGVWYRGPFEHMGSVATLEDWFDPRRTSDKYVPTGYVGYKVKARAVKGHNFGLNLSEEDRKALIAFLKTL